VNTSNATISHRGGGCRLNDFNGIQLDSGEERVADVHRDHVRLRMTRSCGTRLNNSARHTCEAFRAEELRSALK
jgi:hypothetical protein